MWKENKKTMILTSILILLPILAGIVLWKQLPDQVATHFGYGGEADGWSSKGFAVFGLPAILLAIHWLCMYVTGTDPKYDRYPEKMKKIVLWICPVVSWIGAYITYSDALGKDLSNMDSWVSLLLGLVFVIVGNYLPKVKQNYYLGIKLPWTYASEENWNKTHRMAGKLWVAGGIIFLVNFFFRIQWLEVIIMFAMILIPVVYSYLYSRKEQKKGSES